MSGKDSARRWWGKMKVEDRIRQDVTVAADDFAAALSDVCEQLDLTKPIVTRKHENEMSRFNRTVFYPDDFIESVRFDAMEIERLVDRKKK